MRRNYFARDKNEEKELAAAVEGLPPGPLLDAIAVVKVELKRLRAEEGSLKEMLATLDVLARLVRAHLAGQQRHSFEDITQLLARLDAREEQE